MKATKLLLIFFSMFSLVFFYNNAIAQTQQQQPLGTDIWHMTPQLAEKLAPQVNFTKANEISKNALRACGLSYMLGLFTDTLITCHDTLDKYSKAFCPLPEYHDKIDICRTGALNAFLNSPLLSKQNKTY
jgi:hypothetical protein